MGLKTRLKRCGKKTELAEEKEFSLDLGDNGSIIEALGLIEEKKHTTGGYLRPSWTRELQLLFKHPIDMTTFDYQIASRYRKEW